MRIGHEMPVKQCQDSNTILMLRFLQEILVTGLIFIIYFSSHKVPKHESFIFIDIHLNLIVIYFCLLLHYFCRRFTESQRNLLLQ